MAVGNYVRNLVGTGTALAFSILLFSGCGAAPVPPTGGPTAPNLPALDSASVTASLPWLVESLDLDSRYPADDFQITSQKISPDRRYAIVNISNGAKQGTSGPFYRFVVFNPKAEQIFFPPESELRSKNLGYPYLAAEFDDGNRVAIAYGYRSIMASIVALPEGEIIESHDLDVFEVDEIEEALGRLLEASR